MQTFYIDLPVTARRIPFVIGENLWASLTAHLKTHFSKHAIFLVTDTNVATLYGKTAESHLQSLPNWRGMLTFPAGEQSKSRAVKAALEDELLQQKAGRDSMLIAMGGGVTGDLVGYVAATLHRGIPLIHLPTTLLAMVDSSIGGKTGINHPAGKNLIGAFYQPDSIWADVNFLETLPQEEFLSGMAEVIKYAAIGDDVLWDQLEKQRTQILQKERATLTDVISRCAEHKIRITSADEKEAGLRGILNFGHTIGHALENLSDYQILHGFAIAAGMVIAARLSNRLFQYPAERVQRLQMRFGGFAV
jgi:3-dehydroquinate synthase